VVDWSFNFWATHSVVRDQCL